MTRDTSTGTEYEKRIYDILKKNNLEYKSQVLIGVKRNGRGHRVDVIIDNTLVSLKYQQINGSTDEKVPFEFMKLQHAVEDYNYDNAIIVLSGDTGWSWKEYYLSNDEFKQSMKILYPDVMIISHEDFITLYDLKLS